MTTIKSQSDNATTPNLCFSKRNSSVLNGLWSYFDEWADYPEWEITTTDTYRLWYNTNQYVVTDTVTWNTFYARCDIDTTDATACDGNWKIPYSSDVVSSSFAQYNSCPSWDCDEVIISSVGNTCNGIYDQ